MPLISTFAALSARGFGAGLSNPSYFGGTGYIGYQSHVIVDSTIDSSGNSIFLLCDAGTLPTSSAIVSYIASVTQYGALNFYKSISFLNSFQGICITVDSSNNILVGGQLSNTGYMAKFTNAGVFSWGKYYSTLTFGDAVISIAVDSGSNIYVGSNRQSNKGIILKHNSAGANTSTMTLTGTSNVSAKKIVFDSFNNMYVSYGLGLTLASPTAYRRLGTGVTCIDASGNTVYTYNPTTNSGTRYGNYVEDIVTESSTQNLYILQKSYNSVSYPTVNAIVVTVTKLSSTGAVLWSREKSITATTASLITGSITLDPTGNVYITFANSAANQTYLVKFDSSGNTIWYNEVDINNNTVYTPPNGLEWFNSRITLSGGGDIENFPDSGKVPISGSYINSTRTYHYAPTFNTSFTSVTVPTTAFSMTTASTAGQGTASSFNVVDVTNTYSLLQIGA